MDVKKNIFILTGAGISKESGIQTFREKDGLWDNHRIEDVCTVDAFLKNPDYVNNFYNQRRKTLTEDKIKPNSAHKNLAILENCWKGEFILVTQNIDNLHEQGGSKKIIHMHGSLDKAYCMNCLNKITLDFDLSTNYQCEKCKKKTLHTRTTPNIILHIFLSIVSLGFWFLIYLLFIHKGRPQCMTCGKGYGDTYSDLAKSRRHWTLVRQT